MPTTLPAGSSMASSGGGGGGSGGGSTIRRVNHQTGATLTKAGADDTYMDFASMSGGGKC